MYVPKKGRLRDLILLHFLERGQFCMEDVAEAFPNKPYNTVTSAVFQLKFYRALSEFEGRYTLSNNILRHYGKDVPEDLQPEPRIVSGTFNRWSGAFSPMNALRREPIRDISFITSGTAPETLIAGMA